jgi:hypothetical protein
MQALSVEEEGGDQSGESASLPPPPPIDPMLDKSQVSIFVYSVYLLYWYKKHKY